MLPACPYGFRITRRADNRVSVALDTNDDSLFVVLNRLLAFNSSEWKVTTLTLSAVDPERMHTMPSMRTGTVPPRVASAAVNMCMLLALVLLGIRLFVAWHNYDTNAIDQFIF
jgi:hypothetical protein